MKAPQLVRTTRCGSERAAIDVTGLNNLAALLHATNRLANSKESQPERKVAMCRKRRAVSARPEEQLRLLNAMAVCAIEGFWLPLTVEIAGLTEAAWRD